MYNKALIPGPHSDPLDPDISEVSSAHCAQGCENYWNQLEASFPQLQSCSPTL